MTMNIMTKTIKIMDIMTITIKIMTSTMTATIRSFEFDPDASCTGCSKDTKVAVINLGLQVTIIHYWMQI